MAQTDKFEEKAPAIYEEVMEEDARTVEEKALRYKGDRLDLSEGNASFEIETDRSGSDVNVWTADGGTLTLELTAEELWELADVLRQHVDFARKERGNRVRVDL